MRTIVAKKKAIEFPCDEKLHMMSITPYATFYITKAKVQRPNGKPSYYLYKKEKGKKLVKLVTETPAGTTAYLAGVISSERKTKKSKKKALAVIC